MTAADLDAFAEALQAVAFVCTGRRASDDHVRVYFGFLQDLPIAPLVRALEKFGRTVETGRKFPSPREIREWISQGGTADGLTADQETRIRAAVAEAMERWRQDGQVGSARTAFELAWQSALVGEGLRGGVRPRHREAAWQRWQWHGAATSDATPEYTKAEAVTILRDVLSKPPTNVHPNQEAERQRDGGARLKWMRDLADDIERRAVKPGRYGLFGNVLAKAVTREREPGEDDD